MEATDQELIEACRRGSITAWETVLLQYQRLIFSIPLNYGLSHADAADVTQLTFTILLQNLDNLLPDTRLAPWLATVARRHTWRLLEKHKREQTQKYEDLRESLSNVADPRSGRILEKWELVEWLEQGFAALDKRCTALLLALYFDPEQPAYAEVAERLQMPLGSIGPTRARCLKRLRQLLTEALE